MHNLGDASTDLVRYPIHGDTQVKLMLYPIPYILSYTLNPRYPVHGDTPADATWRCHTPTMGGEEHLERGVWRDVHRLTDGQRLGAPHVLCVLL